MMYRSLHRPLLYLAVGLAACALLPWAGVLNAQPPRSRIEFPPYQPPGFYRPSDPFAINPVTFNPTAIGGGGLQGGAGGVAGIQGGNGGGNGGGIGGGLGGG